MTRLGATKDEPDSEGEAEGHRILVSRTFRAQETYLDFEGMQFR
jgi:hypothetical protein